MIFVNTYKATPARFLFFLKNTRDNISIMSSACFAKRKYEITINKKIQQKKVSYFFLAMIALSIEKIKPLRIAKTSATMLTPMAYTISLEFAVPYNASKYP